ncbi:hypothetical protein FDP41_012731 [Naegleria fowleri]|uniref:Zn(2)-C6 fungal-type domain-containing protein n=1 Tax=Naegleria fowleri TaxID=5763 RepID=A0A6A5BSA9_NAEFO|nr:uncharacterized protein FDP41_012731 [Naegleria fowleri]KAF0980943.1 hypothetical protein FDP41_012731 [Naegleria fowleri]
MSVIHEDLHVSGTGSSLREQPIEQFSSIACVQCRKGHRKCDKRLPNCSNCKRLGKECSYRSPKKRGPQPKKGENENPLALPEMGHDHEDDIGEDDQSHSHSHQRKRKQSEFQHDDQFDSDFVTPGASNNISPQSGDTHASSLVPTTNSHIDHSSTRLSEEYIKKLCFDVYKEIVGDCLPAAQKTKMDKLMNHSLSGNNIVTGAVKKKKLMNEIDVPDLALLYALQSVCFQRIGQHDLSKQLYQRSRQTVSTVFDNITDFNVVCSYAYLSSYLVGEGDFLGAKFYLNSVLFYLEQQKHNTSESDAAFLKSLTTVIHLAMEEDKSQVCFLLNRLLSLIITKHPELNIEASENRFLICEEELSEKMRKLDLLTNSLSTSCTDTLCSSKKDLSKIVYLMYLDTMRIKVLEKHGMKDSIHVKEAADRITSLTRIPTFELAPVIVVRSIAVAARVHYNLMVKDLSAFQDDMLVRSLSDDLKALKLLGTKYEVVKTRFQQLIRDIELILEQVELFRLQRHNSFNNGQPQTFEATDIFSMINSNPNFYTPYLFSQDALGNTVDQNISQILNNEQQPNQPQHPHQPTEDMFLPPFDAFGVMADHINLANTSAQQNNLDFLDSLNVPSNLPIKHMLTLCIAGVTTVASVLIWHYLFNYEQARLRYNDQSESCKELLVEIPILSSDPKHNTTQVGDYRVPHLAYKYRYPLLIGNFSLLHDVIPNLFLPLRNLLFPNFSPLHFETKFFTDFDDTLEDICLDFLRDHSPQSVSHHSAKPVILIFPGITGSSESYYVQSLIRTIQKNYSSSCPYHIVVYNRPGCHSLQNSKLRKAKFFLNSHKKTVERVIDIVSQEFPNSNILLVGYSAGGVGITKQLGSKKVKKNTRVIGAITISQPFDMVETLKTLERNKAYNKFLVTFILEVFKKNRELLEGAIPAQDLQSLDKCKTIDEIDTKLTKPLHGLRDVTLDFYNKRSTFMKHLQRISGEKMLHRVKTTQNELGENVYYEEEKEGAYDSSSKGGETEKTYHAPVFIMLSKDDQIIAYNSAKLSSIVHAKGAENLYVIETQHGGHCSFFEQFSWWLPGALSFSETFADKVVMQTLAGIVKHHQKFVERKQ